MASLCWAGLQSACAALPRGMSPAFDLEVRFEDLSANLPGYGRHGLCALQKGILHAGACLRALHRCSSAAVQTTLTSTAMSTPATTVASARRVRCRTTSRGRGTATPTSMGMPTKMRRGRRPLRPTALASGALSTHVGRPSIPRGGRTHAAPCCMLQHRFSEFPERLWPVACQPHG